MYLRKRHIEGLARSIVRELTQVAGLIVRDTSVRVEERICSVIKANQEAERALEDEADELLHKQLRAAGNTNSDFDHHRARQLIKKELAKQRKFVL